MKSTKTVLLVALLFTLMLDTQSQVKSYSLKKGQALDLLFFSTNPDAKETMDRYFKRAIPEAIKNGYLPQKGFKISQSPLQGNYWPETLIIGLWKDFEQREQFTNDIIKDVPDFHEMRREIWTSFNLTYWKIAEDKDFTVDSEKFNVLTAYWSKGNSFEEFNKKWLKEAKKSGGRIVLELTDGTSPFGYYYDPDYVTITEWDSKEAFDSFNEKNKLMDHKEVKHVNQFIIE